MSLVFTVVCIVSMLCKISSHFTVLLVGRLFGGIATSLLFTTFEAWYLHQHINDLKLPASWISDTFSVSTFYNSILAILAGVVSNVLTEDLRLTPLAPFLASIPVLILCSVVIANNWTENYGDTSQSTSKSCFHGLINILRNKTIFKLGVIQTCVESAMYIFVFLWTPVLDTVEKMPLGWIFSTFMVAIMIGSQVSSILHHRDFTHRRILTLSITLMVGSLSVAALATRQFSDDPHKRRVIAYVSFLCFEAAIGAYFPTIASLRGEIIPEDCRASVMTWFRLPLNIITCLVLLATNIFTIDKSIMFMLCGLLCFIGLLTSFSIDRRSRFIIHL